MDCAKKVEEVLNKTKLLIEIITFTYKSEVCKLKCRLEKTSIELKLTSDINGNIRESLNFAILLVNLVQINRLKKFDCTTLRHQLLTNKTIPF